MHVRNKFINLAQYVQIRFMGMQYKVKPLRIWYFHPKNGAH